MQSIKIADICREVGADSEGLLKRGQQFKLSDHSRNAEMITDKNVLVNILFNLISNAIKYSEEHTTIHCTVYLEDGTLKIEVEDEGIGIPIEDQKHLFTRFFRASNAANIQGTGLGLNIVAGYVDMLNGKVEFESIPEKGS